MQDLYELLMSESRARHESLLNEDQFLNTLRGAANVFREGSLRVAGILPFESFDDMGVLKSRRVRIVDMNSGSHGMEGTGGTEDLIDISDEDQLAYAMWSTGRIPKRIYEASKRNEALNLLTGTGQAIGETLRELENKFIVAGLGPVKGITTTTGIQTFASAGAWGTAGIAWQDIIKARGLLRAEKIAVGDGVPMALLVNPSDAVNLYQVFSNTDAMQLEKVQRLLTAGIFESTYVTAGKAYVYAWTPNVAEIVSYQDLSIFPLPMLDEDPRVRGRLIDALHVPRPRGVVEITSVDA